MPPAKADESRSAYHDRAVRELRELAGALQANVAGQLMEIEPLVLSGGPELPHPRTCALYDDKARYDLWLELIYEEGSTFLFEVSERDGQELRVFATNPDPRPDAARTRSLLAGIGQSIVEKRFPAKPTPLEDLQWASKGIIFVYDASGSTYETDPQARNRLAVGRTIGAILEHSPPGAASQPTPAIPFAAVVFAETARVIESAPGSEWFRTTPGDLQLAYTKLAPALSGMGRTSIQAAFAEVKRLIASRTDIDHWHVIFLTDGVPTSGITDYHQIQRAVETALAHKSTLSVIALHGKGASRTEDAKLAELVRATLDNTGRIGEIINITAGDDPARFQRELERIAFLINESTVRERVALTCVHVADPAGERCTLDGHQAHALRFGAARKVTFIADAARLPSGACTAMIENEGLGAPRIVTLARDQQTATLDEAGSRITLLRNDGRISITIEMRQGRVNGDWKISLAVDASAELGP